MSEPALTAPEVDPAATFDGEVESAIALCGGDVRAALRATLIANSYLQGEVDRLEASASPGFARRRRQRVSKAAEGTEKKAG
jgi:hypothetical protein